jgi:hypothetical protein
LSDVISLPPEQTEAAIARIRAEKERRAAERIEAGEIVSIQLFIVAGSETEAHGKVEQAKATSSQSCAPPAICARGCST